MRKPMVTRTFTTTRVNVMCMDIERGECINKDVELARTYKDDKKLLKAVEEIVNTDTIKAVHIVDKSEIDKLYGMSEQKFLEFAEELDPETRKTIEE